MPGSGYLVRAGDMEVRTCGKQRLEMEFKVKSVREWSLDVNQSEEHREAE